MSNSNLSTNWWTFQKSMLIHSQNIFPHPKFNLKPVKLKFSFTLNFLLFHLTRPCKQNSFLERVPAKSSHSGLAMCMKKKEFYSTKLKARNVIFFLHNASLSQLSFELEWCTKFFFVWLWDCLFNYTLALMSVLFISPPVKWNFN
jgi:hypothetical protein